MDSSYPESGVPGARYKSLSQQYLQRYPGFSCKLSVLKCIRDKEEN